MFKKQILIIELRIQDNMISVKIYKQRNDTLVGACDKELIGKIFREGKLQLAVKKEFYDGIKMDVETLQAHLNNATIANLVGEKTVNCAIEMGLVNPDCVMHIKGIPHAQFVKMH